MVESQVILLADDSDDDIRLIRRAFQKANILNPLQVVRNGDEALAYLQGDGEYANRAEYPLPSLLLLDLKMPRRNGFEVLSWVRAQPGLSGLRIVVLTGSDEMRDVNLAYQLGANSFLVKPVEFERFVAILQALQGYWLWLSRAPETSRPAPRPNRAE
jgi:CheY-like chemotaxis protein